MNIDYALKRKCAELANSGVEYKKIYDDIFLPAHDGMGFETFRHKIRDWRKKKWADDVVLESASLDWKFNPYAATVQVDSQGNIIQSWIKQNADSGKMYADLISEIRKNTPHVEIKRVPPGYSGRMLEIPFYDMHLGITDLEWYKPTVQETLEIIYSRKRDKIIIPIGQDLFHNDDLKGRTSSGRQIEKVDMVQAWKDAKSIYCSIIDAALEQAGEVEVIYVRGNHDESTAWAFVQLLAERYCNVSVDDSLDYRKVRTFGTNFIGFTHGDGKKSNPRDLRGQFTIKFPVEFAGAKVREIHAGHLHTEQDADEYGVMVRRLCSGKDSDDWHDYEGFIGSHQRFMLFDWSENKLSAIHYV